MKSESCKHPTAVGSHVCPTCGKSLLYLDYIVESSLDTHTSNTTQLGMSVVFITHDGCTHTNDFICGMCMYIHVTGLGLSPFAGTCLCDACVEIKQIGRVLLANIY